MQERILLDAGSGGRASQRLINGLFLSYFDNPVLSSMEDAATFGPVKGRLAMSVDGYTVEPLVFPGGSIGTLAINGTVNDISMVGAAPQWMTASFIIEEGLPMQVLELIVKDMAQAARIAGVRIVTGDTKVVPKGTCDKLFITTSGVGEAYADPQPSASSAKPGDAILVSGTMGDHGVAIMAARESLSFISDAVSDCAPLNHIARELIVKGGPVHVLRDPTRGGLASALTEIAEQSGVCMEIDENQIPVTPSVAEACSFLGLDPLYLANEGKLICILPSEQAETALQILRSNQATKDASIIGKVTRREPRKVIMRTRMGGERLLDMLEGAPLPRIC